MPLFLKAKEEFELIQSGLKTAEIKCGLPLPGKIAIIQCEQLITHATITHKEKGRLTRVLKVDNYKNFFPKAKGFDEAVRLAGLGANAEPIFTAYHLWFPEASLLKKLFFVRNKLNSLNISWALCDTAASYCYGSRCKIETLDILIKNTEERENAERVLAKIDGFRLFDLLRVDLELESYLFFMDNKMEENLKQRKIGDVELPIIPVEDNMILKALRRQKTKNIHDLLELKDMIRNEPIDLHYLRKKIQTFHVESRVNPIFKAFGLKVEVERFGVATLE